MSRTFLILILFTTAFLTSKAQEICDMRAAEEWCDRTMLHRVEGIWEYPDDRTQVLVRRAPGSEYRYDIVVVNTPDTRLRPGETIGYLQASPSSVKFEMGLYRDKRRGVLRELGKCVAELAENDNAILVSSRKVKFNFGLRWLLPSFWKQIRNTVGITVKDPLESLPRGMVRIYPVTQRRQPDYL